MQVLNVGGRGGEGVHVVGGAGPQVSLPSLVMEAGAVPGLQPIPRPETSGPKRPRMAESHASHALPPLRIDTRESKVSSECVVSGLQHVT